MLLLLLLLVQHLHAAEWLLAVDGSKDWDNYRHNADTCHAYQIAHRHGIPDDHIIVMQFDNIANDYRNPFPDQLFNSPTRPASPGDNVYAGCKKDYTGYDVTAQQFLAVLTGNTNVAKGKVLESTEEDHVFVAFFDHGSPGLLSFPSGPYLTSSALLDAFSTMRSKKMYRQLTIYVEACESGSMFESLPTNWSIYATTAANPDEPSYATYCPPEDMVQGIELNTCLGDTYSVNWLQEDDAATLSESLERQFLRIKQRTPKSHVMQYGDLKFVHEPISKFLGDSAATEASSSAVPSSCAFFSQVSSRDVPLHLAYYRYLRASGADRIALGKELEAILNKQIKMDQLFGKLNSFISGTVATTEPVDRECYLHLLYGTEQILGRFDDYTFQYAKVLQSVCQQSEPNVRQVLDMIKQLSVE